VRNFAAIEFHRNLIAAKNTALRLKREILSKIYAKPPQSGRRILKSAAKPQYEQTQAG